MRGDECAQIANRDQERSDNWKLPTDWKLTIDSMQLNHKTKQILICLFLLCFAFISSVSAQPSDIQSRIGQAQIEFDNGNYSKVDRNCWELQLKKQRKQMTVFRFQRVWKFWQARKFLCKNTRKPRKILNEAFQTIPDNEANAVQKAQIYLDFAWLYRSQRKFAEALDYSKKAIALAPSNRQILARALSKSRSDSVCFRLWHISHHLARKSGKVIRNGKNKFRQTRHLPIFSSRLVGEIKLSNGS